MPDEVAGANVIDFRGPNETFYAYANAFDDSYEPNIRVLSVGNAAYLLISSDFKLKKILKGWRNRIDVYIGTEDANRLGQIIKNEVGISDPTVSKANPNSNKQGEMELPDIEGVTYQTGMYSLFADIAGRHYSYLDETGRTLVYIDCESPKSEHTVMEDKEIHIGCTLKFKNPKKLNTIHGYSSGNDYVGILKNPNDERYGNPVFGSAAGLIVITMIKSQMMQLGGALLKLTE